MNTQRIVTPLAHNQPSPRSLKELTSAANAHRLGDGPLPARRSSPHTSTASPLLWIMVHHSVCWYP